MTEWTYASRNMICSLCGEAIYELEEYLAFEFDNGGEPRCQGCGFDTENEE